MEKTEGGKIAYETYCEAVGGVSVHGEKLWTWVEMCERNVKVAQAWRLVAAAVLRTTVDN